MAGEVIRIVEWDRMIKSKNADIDRLCILDIISIIIVNLILIIILLYIYQNILKEKARKNISMQLFSMIIVLIKISLSLN